MFGGRFGFTRFALREFVELETEITEHFRETARALISLGSVTDIDEPYRCRAEALVTAVRGVSMTEHYEDRANAYVYAICEFSFIDVCREIGDRTIYISSILHAIEKYAEKSEASIAAATNILISDIMRENASNLVHAGSAVNAREAFRETGFATINASIIELIVVSIAETIPAGGELRIDGEIYSVLLNGVNALHAHSGEFPRLDRHAITLSVLNASNAPLTGQLLYNERYL